MNHPIDRYLLFRIRRQYDPEAFAQLYDRYVTAMYRFILLKVPSKEDAEDITSEVFLKCWNYVQEHREIKEIRALLYTIARNAIADWYRSRAQHPDRSLAVTFYVDETSTDIEADFADGGKGKLLVEARAELSLVMGRLERLKEDYRDVLMLRLVDGLPFSLIAKILDKAPGAVRVLYHRAKKALDMLNQE
ncbi:MAG: RNA polymerase sigma factor [Candidatus Uhrbacteria bacterium]|nr:RNA polymerase sigma factor [Candidatus Uhrbacteria bacterium]